MAELINNNEVEEALSKVISIIHSKSIVELDMVETVNIDGNSVYVTLRPPENCLCPYPFFLAALAEKRIKKIENVDKVKVDVILK
ncbi:hypothetical protein BMS3Bbin15_00257 [archaeon BMS3Bbin15]|nr:hypothetical protein BMS3Bbin15_00257 [archaeon BMS3Bbin15]